MINRIKDIYKQVRTYYVSSLRYEFRFQRMKMMILK